LSEIKKNSKLKEESLGGLGVLPVSIVKAAASVKMGARKHCKNWLGLVPLSNALGFVHVVTEAGVKPHAINLLAAVDGDGVLGGINELVALAQVVAIRRLVKDIADDAVELGAKLVVRSLVSKAPRREHGDAKRLAVWARHVVKGACVGCV
jgi:hypothetical protein